ncbi:MULTISPECIES: DNA cytosine methyltransferase [Pseudomonas]|uniref:DNA (cytosine-5-)-methyltransferase n=1 Tax=Pseudomonas savastanoi pv. savastanoi NCPPB 3335 TaxID=693985 RepID=A0ABC8BFH6_PSESS|nr:MULTISPECIES: DNA cytosine methyltransferase [Pseudomonas]ARD12861.1 cytosine methyltransferase [Pseudomonas savastanoi pv. savastanoi NCPPB 3335]KAA3536622.1 cytosine methyltransferase [Pseudomonas savastanoi]MBA4702873.1 DNA cytosine methyltransferase [Pseudomonas savastanoi pv. savastanoi]RML75921.1 Cytosine-specific methyltransferase [Pseudomonas savastanoi pv. savastanoi]TSC36735.1 cytosine methyltransferase [Pseudomonas sp. ST1]
MSAHQQYPPLQYGSVCSGIEAATAAWHPLGMEPVWFAEVEPFPSAVLAHHYPRTPNLGDMTKLGALVLAGKIKAPDVLVGGTPCQAFSVAGMRQGMLDPRGALTIKYVELADAVDLVRTSRNQPESIIVWENVPGVLSDKGNAFGCFLGALAGEDCELQPPGKRWQDAGCVYGPKRTIAWRILDAQYFGLAQRRRRVFLVASARADFDPTAVLFEREGVRRDTAPRRGEGQDVTGTAPFGPALQCGCGNVFSEELGHYGCPNCEGDEGPAVSMFGGIPAFGGHSLSGSVERAATLTAKDTRMDMESETFFVQPSHDVTGTLSSRSTGGGGLGTDFDLAGGLQVVGALTSHAFSGGAGGRPDGAACGHFLAVAGTLQANGKAAGSATQQDAESGLLVVHGTQDPSFSDSLAFALGRNSGQENVLAFSCKDHGADAGQLAPTLRAMNHQGSHANAGDQVAVAITQFGEHAGTLTARHDSSPCADRGMNVVSVALRGRDGGATAEIGDDIGNALRASGGGGDKAHALVNSSVRRLTPRECERLQGFPDDYTRIPWRGRVLGLCPDGPRYKAIGNSKAVPVVRWIGMRIQQQL